MGKLLLHVHCELMLILSLIFVPGLISPIKFIEKHIASCLTLAKSTELRGHKTIVTWCSVMVFYFVPNCLDLEVVPSLGLRRTVIPSTCHFDKLLSLLLEPLKQLLLISLVLRICLLLVILFGLRGRSSTAFIIDNCIWHGAWLTQSFPHELLILLLLPEGISRSIHLRIWTKSNLIRLAKEFSTKRTVVKSPILVLLLIVCW